MAHVALIMTEAGAMIWRGVRLGRILYLHLGERVRLAPVSKDRP